MNNLYSPIREDGNEGQDDDRYIPSNGWCSCCGLFPSKSTRTDETDHRTLLNQTGIGGETSMYVLEKLKKLKEFTEVVAGPKWKTFIRKLGETVKNKKRRTERGLFQYDPESYALNFDREVGEEPGDDYFVRTFSSRFTAPSVVDDERRDPNTS